MKIVISDNWGGFGCLVDESFEDFIDQYHEDRANPEFVAWVEQNPEVAGDLSVVEIPDEATDWVINEWDDCYETVFYVVDGKIHNTAWR